MWNWSHNSEGFAMMSFHRVGKGGRHFYMSLTSWGRTGHGCGQVHGNWRLVLVGTVLSLMTCTVLPIFAEMLMFRKVGGALDSFYI